MKILYFQLVLLGFGIPRGSELAGVMPMEPKAGAPSTTTALWTGKHQPLSHWDKQGSTISCVGYCCGLTTSGETNPV